MTDARKAPTYTNWVKGCLGLQHVKNALVEFCDDISTKQHRKIINNIKQRKKLLKLSCWQCSIDTLKPDHVQEMLKRCPRGQIQCNCQSPRGKLPCRNQVCGAIYDEIVTLHASVPPSPNWANTNSRDWFSNPWEISKCFINLDGYTQTKTALDTDCTGLLSVIVNNKNFRKHTLQTESLIQVQRARNELLHSAPHQLDDNDANRYLDVMTLALQDVPELQNRRESKKALRRIKELRSGRYCVTLQDETNVLEDSCESIKNELLRRVGDVLQIQLEAMDKLDAFKLNDMRRRELARAVQNLKDIWNKTSSLEMFMDKTQSPSRPPLGQFLRTDLLADFQNSAVSSSQRILLNNFYDVVEKGRTTIQELEKNTSNIAEIHNLERLYQSCMEKLHMLKQSGDFITTGSTLSSAGIPATPTANASIKLCVVKASCFPRYEYALENVIDILKRYKNVFGLPQNGEPVSRDIAVYFCKANSEINFPCNITDIVSEYSSTKQFDERGFSWLTDSSTKKERSGCSVFVASGNMEELGTFEYNKPALILFLCRSEREARAVSKRPGMRSRENVLIVRKGNVGEQVEKHLEKGIFHALSPICEALAKHIEFIRFKRRHENTGDVSTIAKETCSNICKPFSRKRSKGKTPKRPDFNKRKTMCSKFEITGKERKGLKKFPSEQKTINENNKHRPEHGTHDTTANMTSINKNADTSGGMDSAKIQFSPRIMNENVTISPKDEKHEQLSNVLKLDETVLHTVNEETKECLLDELIGLYNMSGVSADEMPNIPEQRDKVEYETLCKKLFDKFPTVVGLGYRMRKLQVAVKDIQDFDTPEKRKDIHQTLDHYNVHEYEIVPMSLKGYLTPGDEKLVGGKRASFGCFAKMQDKKDTDGALCGLLAKHVATSHDVLAKNDGQFRTVGQILQETVTDGGLDMAAARLSVPVGACETRFKSATGRPRDTGRGKFTSTERLTGTKVHMWGAVSKPGKGIITVPDYKCPRMDHTLIQVEDIVDGAQEVEERFAQPGDSGAVTCSDDPGQRYVHPVSMTMGCMNYKEVDEDNKKEVKTKRGKYLTVPLHSGLDQLSQRTGKGFDLY